MTITKEDILIGIEKYLKFMNSEDPNNVKLKDIFVYINQQSGNPSPLIEEYFILEITNTSLILQNTDKDQEDIVIVPFDSIHDITFGA